MKKAFTGLIALLAGAFAAHSQGTVFFGNYFELHPYLYVSLTTKPGTELGGQGGSTTGNPALDIGNGNDWSVALYGNSGLNDPAGSLTECTALGGGFATATFANGFSDAIPGTWYSAIVALIPNTTGGDQTATLQLRAWYNDGGTITSFDNALAEGYPAGTSALANLTATGGVISDGPALTAPFLPSGLGNFAVAILVPEPNTIALCVMGTLALLLRSRQKGGIGVRS